MLSYYINSSHTKMRVPTPFCSKECSTSEIFCKMGKMRNIIQKFSSENLKGRSYLKDLVVNGRIILIWGLQKYSSFGVGHCPSRVGGGDVNIRVTKEARNFLTS